MKKPSYKIVSYKRSFDVAHVDCSFLVSLWFCEDSSFRYGSPQEYIGTFTLSPNSLTHYRATAGYQKFVINIENLEYV